MTQLAQLAKPFDRKYIEKKPGNRGGDYVTHSVVTERLLEIVGPFDFELVEVVRGHAPAVGKHDAREGAIVGVVARLTVTIDGATHRVEEVGTEDNPAMNTDAANLKNAMSDSLKRCAMRLGLGLHLWSQEMYGLDRALTGESVEEPPAPKAAPKEKTLGNAKAADLGKALSERGVEKPLEFAAMVTGRKVKTLAELTHAESRNVFQTADGGDPDTEAA